MSKIKNRKTIKYNGEVKVNVCNIKKDDILILQIPNNYNDLDHYENISGEAKRLSDSLKKDLGFRVPVIVLAGDVSFKTINQKELLDIINND